MLRYCTTLVNEVLDVNEHDWYIDVNSKSVDTAKFMSDIIGIQ